MRGLVPGADEITLFLARRLSGEAGGGRSSNAMVVAAVFGQMPAKGDYPLDLGDFSRCCHAFDLAPWELKKRMLPIMRRYLEVMEEKYL